MRCFIALIPDENTVEVLENLSISFSQKFPEARAVKRNNIHLTLKFFSDIDATQIESLKEWIIGVNVNEPVKMVCDESGCFPSEKNPKVFWLGQKRNHQIIDSLYDSLEKHCITNFLERGENRLFKPHVTINRLNSTTGCKYEFKKVFEKTVVEIIFGTLALVKSTLTPVGARHEVIFKKIF